MASPVYDFPNAYHLQKDQGYFWTGTRSDGIQAFITYTVTDVLVLQFDKRGAYIGKRILSLSAPATERFSEGICKTNADFHENAESDILRIVTEMNLESNDIFVQQFHDDDTHCGVEVISEDAADDMPDWRGEGRFLLWLYGVDYWISNDGRVHSHG